MIKINLLGVARPTARPSGPPATAARLGVIFVGCLLVAFGIVGFLYWYWSQQVETLEQQLKKEKAEQARLAAIQAENQRYLQRRRELEQRINTIQMLVSSRVGPVELMTALGGMVNRTNDLYLLSVSPEGGRLVVNGQANSVESIANFIAALKTSGTFAEVHLRRYYQDDQYNRTSFKFNLDCVYKPPTVTPAGATPTSAPATPAQRAGL